MPRRGRREKVEEMNAEDVHQDIDLAAPDLLREHGDVVSEPITVAPAPDAHEDGGAETAFDPEANFDAGAHFEPTGDPDGPAAGLAAEPAPPTGSISAERLAA